MNVKYPVLAGEIVRRGIKKTRMATVANITTTSLNRKISGETPFTWDEVCTIQSVFFPDVDKDVLMRETPRPQKT